MSYIADLHIHSRYSRATSADMDLEHLARWAKIKGISMLGTGDFTHPLWLGELRSKLEESGRGVFSYDGIDFILSTEVSNIYFKGGRTRKVHTIICAPSFDVAGEINKALAGYGDLVSDGRPTLSLDCRRMAQELFGISGEILIIPAHAWTPHFGIFGSRSGFDSPEECFEEYTDSIFSIETGLSSDPPMNWRWSKLDRFTLTSHSDAHSPSRIGREANVFAGRIDYPELFEILKTKDATRLLSTLEFFPEEGKYHFDGHRLCKERLSPEETARLNGRCPRCGKKATIGVMHRVQSLSDRDASFVPDGRPSYRSVVGLSKIIGDAIDKGPETMTVGRIYQEIVRRGGNELRVLLELPEGEVREICDPSIADAVMNVRKGRVEIAPGYDGEYGSVQVAKENKKKGRLQESLF